MLKPLCIGDKTASLPIIQGGMGIGVSRSSLAGAVARAGGIGIISSAQIGFDEEGFDHDQQGCNNRALVKHIRQAKEIAQGNGLVGVNVMAALKHYQEHVRVAAEAGADVIICGAGLPMELPGLVEGTDAKIAPIISSQRAAQLILRKWDRTYGRTADFLVVEGVKAGGHLGYREEEIAAMTDQQFDEEIQKIIACKKPYEEKYGVKIPVVVGGGVFDYNDIEHMFALGADGVQIASRFVATYECDASEAYKQAYIRAGKEDIRIIKSPVGMPGRALNNAFVQRVSQENEKITKCYNCISKCNPGQVPYCITKALVNAVKGDLDNGLIFCGANVDRIHSIVSVQELMEELSGQMREAQQRAV